MRTAVVDGDIVAYQAAASSEQAVDWGDGMWTLHAFEQDAITHFQSIMGKIKERTEADHILLCYSGPTNWRKAVLPTYKSNRAGTRKPMLLGFLRKWSREQYDCRENPQLEGDDIMGKLATGPNSEGFILCTIDKDLKTIPGRHYNFGKDEFFEVTPKEADRWHLIQTLTGDTTDGYAGCPGIGPKTAEKILAEGADWEAVVKAYAKAGLGEEEALVQARVARILRHDEYDFETNQVKLWTPNKLAATTT